MLGNYLTTALRHLWRERGYAAINLFGLAVGLALCLLVIQLAAYQLSVGDFHEKKGPHLPHPGHHFLGQGPVQLCHAGTAWTCPRGPAARSRRSGPLHREQIDTAAGGHEGGDLGESADRGPWRPSRLRLSPSARYPRDGPGTPVHHGADRAPGPPSLRRCRSHGPGGPRQGELRLRGHRHRRPAAPGLAAPVLGPALPRHGARGESRDDLRDGHPRLPHLRATDPPAPLPRR